MTNRRMDEIVRRQNPATLPSTASVQEACRIMRDRKIGAILVTMGLSPDFRVSWIVGLPWLLLLTAAYFLWKRRQAARAAIGS